MPTYMYTGIKPVKGRAVIFATARDDSPGEVDYKTQYISEPVIKGTKLVANVHVHEFNFVKAEAWRCFEPRRPPGPDPQQQQQQGNPDQQQANQQQQQQRVQQVIPGLRTTST